MRIELTTKPWQGLVLPLAPYPHLSMCVLYMLSNQMSSTIHKYFLVQLVREAGLEPASLTAADFKSAVYTIPPLSHKFGRSTRIRTLDPLVPNQVRYQTAPHSD